MTMEPRSDEKPGEKPLDPTKEKEEKVGWIEGLAQRSAGLPPKTEPPKKDQEKSPWSYAGVGLQFAATTAIFVLMGMYVDRRMGSAPWATVGLTMLGLVGGLYLLIKDAIKENADPKEKGRRK